MSAADPPMPLTLGTAGHVDHGKTALVRALTGVDTDRLPEERARKLTIVLGYAPLQLPSGRRLSLVDVPGHERFVRTMVAGASGIDAHVMVIAADDGVMPQTGEHARVLAALGVQDGVTAITKSDLASPERAIAQARELLPGCEIVACSARTRVGIEQLRRALERLAGRLVSRASAPGPQRLHIDRVFTVTGRGTVVTGTLWSGALSLGDTLEVSPRGLRVGVRGLEVHGEPVERAPAGQRVAVNVRGARPDEISRGDLLCAPGSVREALVLDCALGLRGARSNERVQIHHGTRDVPGRLSELEPQLWQVRLERPLLALDGDQIVVRRHAPTDTLGGGVILDSAARRHGRRAEIIARLRALRDGRPAPGARAHAAAAPRRDQPPEGHEEVPDERALAALERELRCAGAGMLSEAQLDGRRRELRALRRQGRAVRVSGRLYAHAEVAAASSERILALIEQEGAVTLPRVRDVLGLSRKSAQAFLEHLDAQRLTRREADDRRVLTGRRRGGDRL